MTQSVQYGSEPTRQQVTGHQGNIVATFYSDKYLRERQFLSYGKGYVNNDTQGKLL